MLSGARMDVHTWKASQDWYEGLGWSLLRWNSNVHREASLTVTLGPKPADPPASPRGYLPEQCSHAVVQLMYIYGGPTVSILRLAASTSSSSPRPTAPTPRPQRSGCLQAASSEEDGPRNASRGHSVALCRGGEGGCLVCASGRVSPYAANTLEHVWRVRSYGAVYVR